jgi:hypothetical protein
MLAGCRAKPFSEGAKWSRSFRYERRAHGEARALNTRDGKINTVNTRASHCAKDESGLFHDCKWSPCGGRRSSGDIRKVHTLGKCLDHWLQVALDS